MWTIRRATPDSIDTLTDLRQRFLAEIGYASDNVPDAVRSYLEEALPAGNFVAFVAERNGHIIATSGVLLRNALPKATGGRIRDCAATRLRGRPTSFSLSMVMAPVLSESPPWLTARRSTPRHSSRMRCSSSNPRELG